MQSISVKRTLLIAAMMLSSIGDNLYIGVTQFYLNDPTLVLTCVGAFALGQLIASFLLAMRTSVDPRRQALYANAALAVLFVTLALFVSYYPADQNGFIWMNALVGLVVACQRPAEEAVFAATGIQSDRIFHVSIKEANRYLGKFLVGFVFVWLLSRGGTSLLLLLNAVTFLVMSMLMLSLRSLRVPVQTFRREGAHPWVGMKLFLQDRRYLIPIAIQTVALSLGLMFGHYLASFAKGQEIDFGILLGAGAFGAAVGGGISGKLSKAYPQLRSRIYHFAAFCGPLPMIAVLFSDTSNVYVVAGSFFLANVISIPLATIALSAITKSDENVLGFTFYGICTVPVNVALRWIFSWLLIPITGPRIAPAITAMVAIAINAFLLYRFRRDVRGAFEMLK